MTPVLAILTPTLATPERRTLLARMLAGLAPQIRASKGAAVWRPYEDAGRLTVGEKRQRMLERESCPFVAFVDDDDTVPPIYVPRVLEGIRAGADVVGFKLDRYEDGQLSGTATHSLTVEKWRTEGPDAAGLYRYYRSPNHLNPIRRDIALSVGYSAMSVGEDADYSRRLYAKHGQTMREHFVDEVLYTYLYRTRPPGPAVEAPPYHDEEGRLTRAGAERAIGEGGSVMWKGRACSRVEQLDE